MHGERDAVVKMQKEHGVTLTELPPQDVAKLTKLAIEVWDELAKKDAASAEGIKRVKEFMAWKGYLG
jgi:galactose-1-phosphate uridylyltransferase